MILLNKLSTFSELVNKPLNISFPVMTNSVVSSKSYSDLVLLHLNICGKVFRFHRFQIVVSEPIKDFDLFNVTVELSRSSQSSFRTIILFFLRNYNAETIWRSELSIKDQRIRLIFPSVQFLLVLQPV